MSRKISLMIFVLLLSLMLTLSASAAAPAGGTVHEGVSVPGIVLGDTRAEVEANVGPHRSCVSNYDPPVMESCSFDVESGGWVSVLFKGSNGGNPSGSSEDIVASIQWGSVEGWVTTAGVDTTLAYNDKQAVVNAYPNADLYYDSVGRLYLLRDPELGIQVFWNHAYIFYDVYLSIFNPFTPPPPPDYIRVADIELFASGKHAVTARALVLDEQNQPVQGAVVDATWIGPKIDGLQVSGTTTSDGIATFTIDKAFRGTYYFSISDVSLDGYEFDNVHSASFAAFFKN